jgi:hypothetical protein
MNNHNQIGQRPGGLAAFGLVTTVSNLISSRSDDSVVQQVIDSYLNNESGSFISNKAAFHSFIRASAQMYLSHDGTVESIFLGGQSGAPVVAVQNRPYYLPPNQVGDYAFQAPNQVGDYAFQQAPNNFNRAQQYGSPSGGSWAALTHHNTRNPQAPNVNRTAAGSGSVNREIVGRGELADNSNGRVSNGPSDQSRAGE